MKRFSSLLCAAFVVALVSAAATPASAGLFDLFKKNNEVAAPGPTPPDAVGSPGGGDGAQPMVRVQSNSDEAQAAMRMDRIEQQMRQLTGQVEQLTFQVRQLQEQLQAVQGGGGTGKRTAIPAPAPAVPQRSAEAPPPAAPANGDAIGQAIGTEGGSATLGAPPRDLGQLPVPAGNQPIDLSTPGSGASASAPPASTGNSRDDYDAAYDLVLKGDYDVAEAALQRFLINYPGDPLAADAQYWIGESLYARQDFRGSADAFLAGYKQYPKSGKAPDMLLKLGLSLSGLGQREAACATYSEILKQYPKSSNALVQRVKAEQVSASC